MGLSEAPPGEKSRAEGFFAYSGVSTTKQTTSRARRDFGEDEGMDRRTKIRYNQLRGALIENLEARGLVEDVYRDKVEEYMDLWVRRQELEKDLTERGTQVMDEKRGMMVENRSMSLEVQVSKQMLAIFAALGFKDISANAIPREGEDEL